MDSPIMSLVVAFIAVSIMLIVGVTILGNVNAGFDCKDLEGYNTTDSTNSSGWAEVCLDVHTQSQQSFNLLVVMLVVIAAIAILIVVRML